MKIARAPVYLIDDDDAMLASTAFLLETLGLQVKSFRDPFAFLHAVRELEPGCLLTDLLMPSMSGLELHATLKKRGIDWPVVLMSGHSSLNAKGRGISAMLEKPFSADQLMTALDGAFTELEARQTT